MTVLVIGASGLLGSNLIHVLQPREVPVIGTYHTHKPSFDIPLYKLDIQTPSEIKSVLTDTQADIVINAAAMTDVDRCERDSEAANAINAEAPATIARHAAEHNQTLVHVSTDYIFDGRSDTHYVETANPNPQQVYGATKLAGEQAVRESPVESLTVRLSFVYGIHRGSGELTGFPSWVVSTLNEKQDIQLFTDQYITPSRAKHSAETIYQLLENGTRGTIHVASRSCVSPYRFGRLIQQYSDTLRSTVSITESSMSSVDRSAPRPRHTCLDVSKVESILNRPQPTLSNDLAAIKHRL